MRIETVDIKTTKGKFAQKNINRIYNSDEKFMGYKAIAVIGGNKNDWQTFHILKAEMGYLIYNGDGQLFSHEKTFRAAKRKCASKAIDHIDAIKVNQNSTSYNRYYGIAVDNSDSIGDIPINVKQKVIGVIG